MRRWLRGSTVGRATVLCLATFAAGKLAAQDATAPVAQPNLAQAEIAARQQLALHPNDATATAQLAELLQREGQTHAALHFWEQAAARAPQALAWRDALADAWLHDGQNEKAAAAYAALLQKSDAALAAAHVDRGAVLLDLGAAEARSGEFERARQAFLTATSVPSAADSATLSLAKVLVTLLRYDEAAPYAARYAAAHPNSWDGAYLDGLIAERLGRRAEAETSLRRAVALDPKQYDSQLSLGSVLREEGKTAEAIAVLGRAVALRPQAAAAHFQLSRAYRATHQDAPAAVQDRMITEDAGREAAGTRLTVLKNQALQAAASGDMDAAMELYRQAIVLAPQDAASYYELALLDEKQGREADERSLLEQAAAMDAENAPALAQLGFLDMRAGRLPQARTELDEALRRDPQCVEALGNLGVLDAKQGRDDDAVRLLTLATEADPAYVKGFANLGLVQAASGRYAEAATALRQAVALDPADTAARAALAAVAKAADLARR